MGKVLFRFRDNVTNGSPSLYRKSIVKLRTTMSGNKNQSTIPSDLDDDRGIRGPKWRSS